MRPEIQAAIRALQAGGAPEEYFRPIYDQYFPKVLRFFLNCGLELQIAEDLSQEVFLNIYRNIGKYRFDATFDTWLWTIVKNARKNALRNLKTGKMTSVEYTLDNTIEGEDGDEIAPQDPATRDQSPLAQALASEQTRKLAEALEELPREMRNCVQLRLFQGLKYREIAAVLDISMNTVKSQISRAYRRLKPLLQPYFEPEEIDSMEDDVEKG